MIAGRWARGLAAAAACAAVAACASTPDRPSAPAASQAGAGPIGKVGKPYKVNGRWYTPAHQPDYEEVGGASWYGEAHQGRPTASGEPFDMRRVSAAHKTLPLPSLVEVTDLKSGRSIRVRVNDRGPFVDGRVIDLSKAAAEQLGVLAQGVAKVRVRYLGPGAGATTVASAPWTPARDDRRERWVVQAGAFAEPANAARAARILRETGRTSVDVLQQDGRTLHRVLVGPWEGAEAARAALPRVISLGYGDARIVPAA
jgi:rare lipoprotein A